MPTSTLPPATLHAAIHPWIYAAIVVVYVLVMLGIGYWCMRRTKTVGDFFLGGRTLGPWMSAFAFGTTYFSSVIFIGYAGKLGWGFGIYALWIALGNTAHRHRARLEAACRAYAGYDRALECHHHARVLACPL